MEFIDRYADSFLAVAKRKHAEDQVYQDVLCWQKICSEHPKLVAFLQSPVVPPAKKKGLLERLTTPFHQLTQHFFLLINKRKRIGLLLPILNAFSVRYKAGKSIQVAHVIAASTVSSEDRQKLCDFIRKLTGARTVNLTIDIDAHLMGGYVLHIDGKRLDASIRTSLKQLLQHWKSRG
ncbi:MAG: ATP synthase F1 subunit delta [Cytophagales bacterium]